MDTATTPDAAARGLRLARLTPETRHIIDQTALEEIAQFGAGADPAAIERLAADGRLQDWPTDEGRVMADLVSDAQEEIAARLRSQQAVLALFGSLGRVGKLAAAG